MEYSRPKLGRMEETLEGGRGPPQAVAPLERERERDIVYKHCNCSLKVMCSFGVFAILNLLIMLSNTL